MEIKTKMSETENTQDGINGRLDIAEENTSNHEDTVQIKTKPTNPNLSAPQAQERKLQQGTS